MKTKRILSGLLTLVMLVGSLGGLSMFPVAAAAAAAAEPVVPTNGAEATESLYYTTVAFNTQAEKIATMQKMVEKDGYEIWLEPVTAEVAFHCIATDQWLMSNPYDVASKQGIGTSSDETRQKLLSQLVIKYSDGDKQQFFNSYKEAALRDQIQFKQIKGGLRVEYTIGRQEKRKLVPGMIEKSSFEENIMAHFEDQGEIDKMNAYYLLKDPNDPKLTERQKKELMVTYAITKTYAIYVFDPGATERELNQIEGFIKKNAPNYTMDQLDADHMLVEYEAKDKAPPLFKMAIEYYIDADGPYVRLPAKGIRFDEGTYKMDYIQLLPYMGAGARERYTYLTKEDLLESEVVFDLTDPEKPKEIPNVRNTKGYNFLPDGSGTLIRFEDIKAESLNLTSKIYGPDYAFNKMAGQNQEKIRMPVYGIIEDVVKEVPEVVTTETPALIDDVTGEVLVPAETKEETVYNVKRVSEGFLAVLVEGDATAEISNECGGNLHKYNSVFTFFYPRPTDSFYLDAASAGSSALWTVSSRRKYSGNYIIRYNMLSGEKANYVGMAEAYRTYLEKNGQLTKIEEANKDIPLYVETFGLIQTAESFMGFPYEADTPLTTFEDNKAMIDVLNSHGITNIKMKLLGWANNGLYTTVPTRLKVEKKLGGMDGLRDLADYALSKGAVIFPDFDFTLAGMDMPFDGFGYKRDTAKTMNNLVAVEQRYSAIFQVFTRRGYMIIAPKRMQGFYENVWKNYQKMDIGSISVASLGSQLNSDFKRTDPYNRDDSKIITSELLAKIQEDNGSVLVEAGNIFTMPYVTDVVKVPLDSSNFLNASESVPFTGMVLHGYKNFAGEAINMAGDYNYALLKALENGASPYFILSYRNTAKLKNTGFYDFYSVNFDIWLSDVLDTYNKLNTALKPVSDQVITGHEFVAGDSRVVKITYSNGKSYVLNYNNYAITYEGKEIAAVDFLLLN